MASTVKGHVRSRYKTVSLNRMGAQTRAVSIGVAATLCLSAFAIAAFGIPATGASEISAFELMMISVF